MGVDDRVVTLADEVVRLRPWTRADAAFLAAATGDPAIQRYNGDIDRDGNPAPPLTIEGAELVIDSFTSSVERFVAGGAPTGVAFAIGDADTGELLGCCGVDDWSTHDVAQIGYWLVPDARGRGVATRSVVLLARWLFELGAARVFMTVVADNAPSQGVARRAGFTHEGTMRGHAVWQGRRCDVLWFGALADEWAHR